MDSFQQFFVKFYAPWEKIDFCVANSTHENCNFHNKYSLNNRKMRGTKGDFQYDAKNALISYFQILFLQHRQQRIAEVNC